MFLTNAMLEPANFVKKYNSQLLLSIIIFTVLQEEILYHMINPASSFRERENGMVQEEVVVVQEGEAVNI